MTDTEATRHPSFHLQQLTYNTHSLIRPTNQPNSSYPNPPSLSEKQSHTYLPTYFVYLGSILHKAKHK